MAEYQLTADPDVVIRTADNASIPNDPDNRDWQEYQAWLAAGGVPDPYVPPPPPEQYVQAMQWFAQLSRAGVYGDWDAWVTSQDEETMLMARFANGFAHDGGIIERAATDIGWTPAQVELWLDEAKKINPYP